MAEREGLHYIYRNVRRVVSRRAVGSAIAEQAGKVILSGIGFSDNYQLFDRGTKQPVATELCPEHPPSLVAVGLDLSRIVYTANLPPAEFKPQDINSVPIREWFVGDHFLTTGSSDVLSFGGKRAEQKLHLTTTPDNIIFATIAALERGIINPDTSWRR